MNGTLLLPSLLRMKLAEPWKSLRKPDRTGEGNSLTQWLPYPSVYFSLILKCLCFSQAVADKEIIKYLPLVFPKKPW